MHSLWFLFLNEYQYGANSERAEIHMIRYMMCAPWRFHERKTSEELRKLVGLEPITTVISGRLRWYGHVMRKN